MRLSRVDITDFRIIESMTIHAQALNAILGDNGMGKTSVLKAIGSVFEGGHQPNFIRRGAKRAKVQLTFDNATTILRTITPKTSTLEIKTADGAEVPKPETFVKTLASGFSFDPLAFIAAKPKERAAYLQRALNISFAPAEITAACGLKPPAPVDLDGLELIRKQVYEARTQVNAGAKAAQGTMYRLAGVLGDDDGRDWGAEVVRIQIEREAALLQVTSERSAVADESAEAQAIVDTDINAKIAELEKERTRQREAIATAKAEAIAEIEEQARGGLDSLAAELATAQERMRKRAHADALRGEIATAEEAAARHKAESEAFTAGLNAIDALKQSKLDSLPIPGVEMRDGDFLVDGIAFDDLNEGAKFLKAFEVGALLPNPLGLMIADGAETLSSQSFEAFREAATNSGFQVFVTRVGDGPLDVQTFEQQQ